MRRRRAPASGGGRTDAGREGLTQAIRGPPPLEVFADIDFSVGEGEFVSVVGPSGCGKTTLLLRCPGCCDRTRRGAFAGAAVRDARRKAWRSSSRTTAARCYRGKTNLGNVLFGMHRVRGPVQAEKIAQAMA